jgi:hypothetical protein
MTQETDTTRTAELVVSAPAVPRPACGRCEDWTTVVHKGSIISPCPVCRLDEYQGWLAVRSGECR